MINNTYNPWAGLASYEDPQKGGKKLKFCGRDNDIYDVSRLIDDNLLLILYGKSGIGKTSLLNAGVFPKLRYEQYLPVSIRLGALSPGISFQEAIITVIENTVNENQGSLSIVNVVNEQIDNQQPDRLWNYFSRHRFFDADHKPIFPVVVLDQFEEVLRYSSDNQLKKALALLNQIQYLVDENHALNDCFIDGKEYFYDFNFRFVISIREDELFLLEDCIDDWSLNMFKSCRYRLRPMKPEQARQVVLVPGRDCIKEDEKEKVVERVIALSKRSQSNDIDTLLLSLVCSYTFERKNDAKLGLANFDFWGDNPMRVYYQDAIRPLSTKQVQYIQKNLINQDGSRKRIQNQILKDNLGEATYNSLLTGQHRILTLTADGHVELLHDQFALTIYEDRENYKAQRDLKLLELRSRYVALRALKLVDKGDAYSAQRITAEILPNTKSEENTPYTPEAEYALRTACYHNTAIFKGHNDSVISAFFSPDGNRIASASKDYTIRIWNSITGAEIKVFKGHTERVNTAVFSPDGKRIVSASHDKNVMLWDVETGFIRTLSGHTGPVISAVFSPDGKRIISGSEDRTIRIWDVETGIEIKKIDKHTSCVNSVAFSPDGKRFASASEDKNVIIWDADTFTPLSTLIHASSVHSAFFSQDGNFIVSTSSDQTIRVWDAATGAILQVLKGHFSSVNYATFSPDGSYIVSASDDNTVRIWDVKTGSVIKILEGHSSMTHSSVFNHDGSRIISASADCTIRLWETKPATGIQILRGHISPVNSIAYSRNGSYILSTSNNYAEDNTVKLWDAKTGTCLLTKEKQVWGSFSPDGSRILTIDTNKDVMVWNIENGTGKTLVGHLSPKKSENGSLNSNHGHTLILRRRVVCNKTASFSPDGKRIISTDNNIVRVWNAETFEEILAFQVNDYIYYTTFSPDGKYIAAASIDYTVRIWDAEANIERRCLPGHIGLVSYAAFSPDGKRIVTADINTVTVWDVETGTELLKNEKHFSGFVFSAAFSPDGTRIIAASEDNTVKTMDSETGIDLLTLKHHAFNYAPVLFSPNGKYIITASNDNTMSIWDEENGAELLSLEGNVSAFSTDCQHIVSASNNTIKTWPFPPLQELIDETRERFKNRQLTPEERRAYYLE